MAGKIPARMPTSTLKANATARAVTLMIGALSVGEKELIAYHQGEGSRQSGQPAEDGDDDGLDQDLGEDVAGGRADGLADADFAHALGDAGEHDVHDADATHQQADAGDQAAAQARVVDEGVDLIGPIFLGRER